MNPGPQVEAADVQRYAAEAVSIVAGRRNADLILLCEHAGPAIPRGWNNLGLPGAFLQTHFALDLGSRDLTLAIGERLGATVIMSEYSRLFLDYNRKQHDPDCFKLDMGGIPIPGNQALSDDERAMRETIARKPVEQAVAGRMEGKSARARGIISIHSFSPVWNNQRRACRIGVMWKEDDRLSRPLLSAINDGHDFHADDNQPYSFAESDWFTLDRHGLSIGIPHAYIEVRNDLICDAASREKMADALALAIEAASRDL